MSKRIIILLAIAALMAAALPASAAAPLKWSKQTTKSACNGIGKPVINVTQYVTGDLDEGNNGGWAVDTYARKIKVWKTKSGNYCAAVRYSGTFDAIAGANSPGEGSTGVLDGDEDGTFVGGYRATIDGTLLTQPAWPRRGNVGTYDYACTAPGVCPGSVDWVGQYFGPESDFIYKFWGWVYKSVGHGRWINVDGPDSGDIG